MAVIYELNPPRLPAGGIGPDGPDALLAGLTKRVSQVAGLCDGIHITESVLGTSRLPPTITASVLRRAHPGLAITISMRVIDKDMGTVKGFVRDAADAGVGGILVVKGDPSPGGPADSGLVPSGVVKSLSSLEGRPELFLSLPSNPDFEKIAKKVAARPVGFITQVVRSVRQVRRICDELAPKGFQIIPVVLLPSEKNQASAKFLGLDWSVYEDDTVGFVRSIHNAAGDVLVTSPNDFGLALDVLGSLRF